MTKKQPPQDNRDSPIAVFVKSARMALGLSQEKLGELLGRTKSNISHWELGKHAPEYGFLVSLSKRSGVPMPLINSGSDQQPQDGVADVKIAALLELASRLNDNGLIILIDKAEELVKKHPKPIAKTA